MAHVHSGHGSPGIKLFGKTIIAAAVQAIKEIKDEVPNKSQENNNEEEEETLEEKRTTDKIIPCPRCKSMETKFCYFNNYNVNQPRHFCKGCQRYWTAGGALRNVPVGAGRRKSKPPLCIHRELSGTFSDNSFSDDTSSGIHFNGGVVEEWHLAAAAAQGGFHHGFPAKRRRNTSSGKSY